MCLENGNFGNFVLPERIAKGKLPRIRLCRHLDICLRIAGPRNRNRQVIEDYLTLLINRVPSGAK
jgi:hypothetical protein